MWTELHEIAPIIADTHRVIRAVAFSLIVLLALAATRSYNGLGRAVVAYIFAEAAFSVVLLVSGNGDPLLVTRLLIVVAGSVLIWELLQAALDRMTLIIRARRRDNQEGEV